MKVAAVQMVSGTSVRENLQCAQGLVREAAAQGAELVVLPEYFCALGQRDADKLDYAEVEGDGPIQHALSAWAGEYGVWLAGGTLPLRSTEPGRVCNALMLWNPCGVRVARYDKIHLFRFATESEHYDESQLVQPGLQPVVAQLQDRSGHTWRIGLSVCYDLRFPELYRRYAQSGADMVLVPSAFTYTTGQAHWEVLLRARAIENQCFVLAPAQGGHHANGRRTWGHSLMLDPWGRTLGEQTREGAGIVMADLDRDCLRQVRQQLPALEHRVL